MIGYRKKYRKDIGINCYNCFSKIWNSQCGYNGSGIGDGEQAISCMDYARTRIGKWIKDWLHNAMRKTFKEERQKAIERVKARGGDAE